MKVISERAVPDGALLAAVRAVAQEVGPDDRAMADWFSNYIQVHLPRLAADVALVEAWAPPGAAIADVGASPPVLVAALVQRGRRVSGVDVAPERFATAISRRGLPVTRCDIEREALPWADDSLDFVMFSEVFEHLRIDPIFTVGEMRRVLKPGGLLALSTPNGLSLRQLKGILVRRELGPPVHREYAKLHAIGHMGHVREYTVAEVCAFLQACGFDVQAVIHRGMAGGLLARLVQRLLPGTRPHFTVMARKP